MAKKPKRLCRAQRLISLAYNGSPIIVECQRKHGHWPKKKHKLRWSQAAEGGTYLDLTVEWA